MAVRAHAPEILGESVEGGRAIALEIPAGESLADHQVHEHAWVTVVSGEVEITAGDQRVAGAEGLTVEFAPGERHAVHARTSARLLLILTPWPGDGHPGAMALEDKQTVRERAAQRARTD
ncbi:MAG TPA: cupin domain-containing protein [Solirubrobacteraceae bacterium]|nr:cupin domain-containing protein [Solirubrobacteraceae bacterium]